MQLIFLKFELSGLTSKLIYFQIPEPEMDSLASPSSSSHTMNGHATSTPGMFGDVDCTLTDDGQNLTDEGRIEVKFSVTKKSI